MLPCIPLTRYIHSVADTIHPFGCIPVTRAIQMLLLSTKYAMAFWSEEHELGDIKGS